jgi:hypothetical protein
VKTAGEGRDAADQPYLAMRQRQPEHLKMRVYVQSSVACSFHVALRTLGWPISSSVPNTQSQKRLVTPKPFW